MTWREELSAATPAPAAHVSAAAERMRLAAAHPNVPLGWAWLVEELVTLAEEEQAAVALDETLGALRVRLSQTAGENVRVAAVAAMVRAETVCQVCGRPSIGICIGHGSAASLCEAHARVGGFRLAED